MTDQPRNRRNLSKLFDTLEESAPAQVEVTQPVRLESFSGEPVLRLPPELQYYLPPDLWRKLISDTPRQGILLNALDRLRSLLHTISTYLPADLVQEKMASPVPGMVSGKMLEGCLLFADVSGFTALSERLAVLGMQGAERLTELINQYFATMIEILAWSGGSLLKFAGDATLVYFSKQPDGMHVQWAARTALRMLRALSKIEAVPTPLGPVSLSMKLGLASGSFLAASIGSPKRMEYALLGPAVTRTMQSEGNTTAAGQVVLDPVSAGFLRDIYPMVELKSGFYLLKAGADEEPDAFEIRSEKRRARGAVPWGASAEEVLGQIEVALRQVQSLTPYLAAELVDRIVAHARERQVQSEFRSTTVMFCNFTGPEALLDTWGKDGVQRVTGLLSAYFTSINEVISRYGGIVSRIDPYSQGTKLLALFGAPVAHEDDPQRAISAALAMHAALQALNQRWNKKLARHLPPGEKRPLIEQRIGITLSETFAGQVGAASRREYTVMGDDVNLSARLMSIARPGQTLVNLSMLERTSDYFVLRPLPPIRVKGKRKPVPVWQVDGPRDDTLLNRVHSRGVLIGREAELARCRGILRLAKDGSGSIITLTGPAGIGKSHMADALLSRAMDEGWRVLAYQCRSYQDDMAYAPWSGLVRSLAGITSIDHPLIQREKVERLTAECGLESGMTTAVIDMLGLRMAEVSAESDSRAQEGTDEDLFTDARQKRGRRRASGLDILNQLDDNETQPVNENERLLQRTVDQRQRAIALILKSVGEKQPLLVFFEDAHWMDAASRECLMAMRKELCLQTVVFLQARRPSGDLPEVGETIQLNPFDLSDTTALVASVLVGGLAEIIHQQSNGNPLFVEEISRWIQRTQKISVDELKSILQSSDILQKLVLSSLEVLPEAQREVVRLASVVGLEFRHSEIEVLLGNTMDPVTLSGHLRSLIQARLITLSEAGVDARYTFAQAIFRDVLYNSMPFERRRALHAQMAEYLANQPGRRRELRKKIAAFLDSAPASNLVNDAETLAYHYEMSEQWQAAGLQLNTMAAQMERANDLTRAEAYYRKASNLLDYISPEAVDNASRMQKTLAQLGLGEAAIRQTDLATAAVCYEASAAALPPDAPASLALRIGGRLAMVLPSQGKGASAEKQVASLLQQAPDAGGWELCTALAWLSWRMGANPTARLAAAREALQARNSVNARRARALLDELSGDFERAAEGYQALGEPCGAALAFVRLGDQFLREEQYSQAGEAYQRAEGLWYRMAQPNGLSIGLALVKYRRAELAWKMKDARGTLALLEESMSDMNQSSPVLQVEPRATVQKALAQVKSRYSTPWETWQWHPFDDLFYIQLLFPIFSDTDRESIL